MDARHFGVTGDIGRQEDVREGKSWWSKMDKRNLFNIVFLEDSFAFTVIFSFHYSIRTPAPILLNKSFICNK